jgi:hypothetical protein
MQIEKSSHISKGYLYHKEQTIQLLQDNLTASGRLVKESNPYSDNK